MDDCEKKQEKMMMGSKKLFTQSVLFILSFLLLVKFYLPAYQEVPLWITVVFLLNILVALGTFFMMAYIRLRTKNNKKENCS